MNQPAFQHDNIWDEQKPEVTSKTELLEVLKQYQNEKGPGEILRQFRELADRKDTSLATELGIALSQLKAIEEDDYDNLPAPIYMKNYFQRYCAALDIPLDDVLKIYQNMKQIKSPELNRVSIKERLNGGNISMRWLLIVGFVIAMGMLGYWVKSLDLVTAWGGGLNLEQSESQTTELSIPLVAEELADKP